MDILIITPAPEGSKAGNRATAERWQKLLKQAGHKVTVATRYSGEPCDLLIALHAWRSYDAVRQFRETWPGTPVIVALTGTDIYRHQHEYPEQTRFSMQVADALIGLHTKVGEDIPEVFQNKLVTLFQSADRPGEAHDAAPPSSPRFDVCVIGHLRDEKDSLRAAMAARLLPADSRIRVLCAGKPHDARWRSLATREAAENPRFQWLGELDKSRIATLMASSQLMVISSVVEGGANVVSEACRAGLAVIASDIPGNVGLLGQDYPGYYPVGNTRALADVLHQAETNPGFLRQLRERVQQLAGQFTPEKERESLEQALELAIQRHSGRRD